MRIGKNLIIPLFIAFIYFLLIFNTRNDIGVTWDEPTYFSCAENIKNVASCNLEHPHFIKTFSALTFLITKHFVDITTALRFATYILMFIFLILFYLIVEKVFNRNIALFSLIALFFMPRIFFHAHLLALDLPVAIFVFLTTFAFFFALERKGIKHIILFSISLAILLMNKITGYFLLVPLVLYITLLYLKKSGDEKSQFLSTSIRVLLISLILAAIILYLFSPPLWKNPLGFFYPITSGVETGYGSGNVYIFGELVKSSSPSAVFTYIPLTLLTTFNSLHVILSIIGLIVAFYLIRSYKIMPLLLLVFFSFLLFHMSPMMYKYDGERSFLMLYPFLALFVGIGAGKILEYLSNKTNRKKLVSLLIILLLIFTGVYTLYTAHPFESSYFNLFVGGTKGVYEKEVFSVTYWQPELVYTLDFVNSLPEGSTIGFIGDSQPYTWYQKIGKIKKSIQIQDSATYDYVGIMLKQSYLLEKSPEPAKSQRPIDTSWEVWNEMSPQFIAYNVTTKDGVDLVRIYDIRWYMTSK